MANVRDYGALGDGVTDDAPAIQHALNDGDGVLEFPRGEYLLRSTIVVNLAATGRTAIHGSGGTAKLLMAAAGPAFEFRGTHTKSADPLEFRPEEWARERFPTLQDIEIEGRHAEADGVRIRGVMQATLAGVLIRQVRHAVHLVERARNVLLDHCHLYHNTGVNVFLEEVNLHQINITGCHISYGRLGGIRIVNSEVRNLQIVGNDIEYNNNRAHQFPDADAIPTAEIDIDCGPTGTVREVTIVGNTIQATYSPNGANIRIVGSDTPERQRAGMLCISGNVIGSQAINVHLVNARGVTLEGNYIYSGHVRNLLAERCHTLVLGANCFGHNPDYKDQELCTGIRLEDCEHVTMTGLQIQDAQAGQHTVTGAIPIKRQGVIELVRCRRVNLTGVQILDGTPTGLFLEDSTAVVITGCSTIDTRQPPKTDFSIEWRGESSGSLIANCLTNREWLIPATVAQSGIVVQP
jgi:hypothetical protein